MIKEFAKYKEPQIGDWIIDLENDLGKITKTNPPFYHVKFDQFDASYEITRRKINYFGTKDDMKMILQANKYNL